MSENHKNIDLDIYYSRDIIHTARSWRNWHTRTFEGRVRNWVRVQVPSTAPENTAFEYAVFFLLVAESENVQLTKETQKNATDQLKEMTALDLWGIKIKYCIIL